MEVCLQCSKYGEIVRKPEARLERIDFRTKGHAPRPKKSFDASEAEEEIVSNFAEIIRQKREGLGLTQKEFSLKVNERESIIQSIEKGKITPSDELAKKLERILGIKLMQKKEKENIALSKAGNHVMTIGDMIKIRKR